MSDFACPNCGRDGCVCGDIGEEAHKNGKARIECDDCDCAFSMWVDYTPVCTIDETSIVLPAVEEPPA